MDRAFGLRLESCMSSFGRRAPAPQSSPDGEQLLGDNPAPMTFDEALAALLALVGERLEVHVMDAGETPHLVATFGGRLQAGYSMTGGEPSDTEAIFVRLDAGEETAAISLDREVFEGGIAHED
jgi:hypothetical protein